jgi:hypothetical protein
MNAPWFCPTCQAYHGPHVDTCPGTVIPANPVSQCATEGCVNTAKFHLERGGVGSDYCPWCHLAIISLREPRQPCAALQEDGK